MFTPQQIRKLMLALGMTRTTELAVRCGVTDDAVRRWLRGNRKPSGPALIVLSLLADEAAAKGKPVLQPA